MAKSNLIRVAQALYCEPWLIRPEMHSVLRDIVADHMVGGVREQERRAIGERLSSVRKASAYNSQVENGAPNQPYDVVNGVAIIPLMGVIGHRLGAIEKSSGATDVIDFIGACAKAADDSRVQACVLHIDSPGGSVGGVADAAAAVERLRTGKPVIAYTDSMMASAAYWIGAAAHAVYAGTFASVGSVGVYIALLDQSAAFASAGVKVEMFKSGDYKGMGTQGTSLTDDQRGHLQERVDALGMAFRAYVQKMRTGISSEHLDGRDFLGSEAVELGFADYEGPIDQAISDALAMCGGK